MRTRRIPGDRFHKARHLAVVSLDGKDNCLGEYDSPESRAKHDSLIAVLAHFPEQHVARLAGNGKLLTRKPGTQDVV